MILEMRNVHVNLGLSHVLQGVNLFIKPRAIFFEN